MSLSDPSRSVCVSVDELSAVSGLSLDDGSPGNGDATTIPSSSLAAPRIPLVAGVVDDMNGRYRRTMEDAHVAVTEFQSLPGCGFFGVYDGHAGSHAAQWCGENLHKEFSALLKSASSSEPVPSLLNRLFVGSEARLKEVKCRAGSTAAVVFIRDEFDRDVDESKSKWIRKLYAANAGDARAVLCRSGEAVRLTRDHKASDVAEIKRIVDSGGFVMHQRVSGVLAVTRALGDLLMKDLVVSNPFTSETILVDSDEFVIIACDGVWDVLTDQEAVNLVRPLVMDPTAAAQALLREALDRDSTDNITCMIVRFAYEQQAKQ